MQTYVLSQRRRPGSREDNRQASGERREKIFYRGGPRVGCGLVQVSAYNPYRVRARDG
jgi:hypothetical protein